MQITKRRMKIISRLLCSDELDMITLNHFLMTLEVSLDNCEEEDKSL